MKYYRLMDDLNSIQDRWFLKDINLVTDNKISVWKFLSPSQVKMPDSAKVVMNIRSAGKPLDFTFADFEVLVVNENVAACLSDEECQLIPLEIKDVNNKHLYFLAVMLKDADCVDEGKSKFDKWEVDDPIRPDLAGEYKSIYKLVVDPHKVPGYSIFRLRKYENFVIVNENMKRQLQKNAITGIRFRDVN